MKKKKKSVSYKNCGILIFFLIFMEFVSYLKFNH